MKDVNVLLCIDDKNYPFWLNDAIFSHTLIHNHLTIYQYDEYKNFKKSSAYKVVVLDASSIYDCSDCNLIKSKIELFKDVDKFIILTHELDENIIKNIQEYDMPNFEYHIPGYLNITLKHAKIVFNTFWFNSTAFYYLFNNTQFIDKNNLLKLKKYYFECLYGLAYSHRRQLKKLMPTSDKILESQFLENYGGYSAGIKKQTGDFGFTGLVEVEHRSFNYNNRNSIRLSQIIPEQIYSQTAFSIVSESSIQNEYSFFTEKIVKPIVAGRMFLVFSGQNYLKNLRKLGFRTFHGIINESYDMVSDPDERMQALCRQIERILTLDQDVLLKECYEICIHNRQVLKQIIRPCHGSIERYGSSVEQSIIDTGLS